MTDTRAFIRKLLTWAHEWADQLDIRDIPRRRRGPVDSVAVASAAAIRDTEDELFTLAPEQIAATCSQYHAQILRGFIRRGRAWLDQLEQALPPSN